MSEMRFFTSFLQSFSATVIPARFPLRYEFYIGYDVGDVILDSDLGRAEFEEAFALALRRLPCSPTSTGRCTYISFVGFNHSNTLTALWNGLNQRAFEDGCHYFFMPNDDLRMFTPGWPQMLINTLWQRYRRHMQHTASWGPFRPS